MGCPGSRQQHQSIAGDGNGNAGFLDQDREKECGQLVRIEETKQQVGERVKKLNRRILLRRFSNTTSHVIFPSVQGREQ
jgi:hypothetical protein